MALATIRGVPPKPVTWQNNSYNGTDIYVTPTISATTPTRTTAMELFLDRTNFITSTRLHPNQRHEIDHHDQPDQQSERDAVSFANMPRHLIGLSIGTGSFRIAGRLMTCH